MTGSDALFVSYVNGIASRRRNNAPSKTLRLMAQRSPDAPVMALRSFRAIASHGTYQEPNLCGAPLEPRRKRQCSSGTCATPSSFSGYRADCFLFSKSCYPVFWKSISAANRADASKLCSNLCLSLCLKVMTIEAALHDAINLCFIAPSKS